MTSALVAAFASAALAHAGPTADAAPAPGHPPEAKRVAMTMNGSVLGLRIVKVSIDAALAPHAYTGATSFRSAGVAGFFKTATVTSAAEGAVTDAGLAPAVYRHTETTGKKTRNVHLTFGADDVNVIAEPRFGSLGDPAPTPAQKAEALDPVSLILTLMTFDDGPCPQTLPVFDSKQRYDLVFEPLGEETVRTRAYRGPATKCAMRYQPIAGYDPEDLAEPEVYATPAHLWIATTEDGVKAPVRFKYRVRVGFVPISVALEATSIAVS